jgi:hypothetical protein
MVKIFALELAKLHLVKLDFFLGGPQQISQLT